MKDVLSSLDVCAAVLEHAADAILVLKDETFVGCNAMAEELFGCSRERIIGQTPYAFSPPFQPDQRDSKEVALEQIRMALERHPQRFEWVHKRCDGTLFDAEVALTRVDMGAEALLVGVVRDITERKRLQDAVHNIAAGISAATGQLYLNLLVQYVARALGACCAFVGELVGEGRIRTAAVVKDGVVADNFEYDLFNSACNAVMGSDLCIYARGVQQDFPLDSLLSDLRADSYVGVPLFDSNREPIGILAAVKRTPIENPDFAEYIMRIFAARTSGELERKKSIQRLMEEKKLTDTIVNSLPGIFYMIDTQGRIVWRNKVLSEVTGGKYDQHGVADPHDWIVEEDHKLYEQALREVLDTGYSSVQIRLKPVDGSIRVYQCIGARIEIGGVPYAIGAGIDVTENREMQNALRDSESKFRAIFENAPIGIYQSTPDGRFIRVNKALALMFGYDSPEQIVAEVTSIPQQLFVHPELRTDFVERVLASEEFLHLENDYYRRDRTIFTTNLYMGALRHNGDLAFLTGFVEDITARKQNEQDKQLFYRETILSVTDGKLVICDPAEVKPYLSNALIEIEIKDAHDLATARSNVRELCLHNGLSGERLETFIAGVGEAATNVLKHANGGTVSAGIVDGAVWVGVSDQGTGIEHITLPRALLLRGFSTKLSLGIGYTVMLDVSDRLLLSTGKHGTTVILIKELREVPCSTFLDRLPDSWTNEQS